MKEGKPDEISVDIVHRHTVQSADIKYLRARFYENCTNLSQYRLLEFTTSHFDLYCLSGVLWPLLTFMFRRPPRNARGKSSRHLSFAFFLQSGMLDYHKPNLETSQ